MRVCQFRHYGTVFFAPTHYRQSTLTATLKSYKPSPRCQFGLIAAKV